MGPQRSEGQPGTPFEGLYNKGPWLGAFELAGIGPKVLVFPVLWREMLMPQSVGIVLRINTHTEAEGGVGHVSPGKV